MDAELPRVVLTTTASVDGRISLGRSQRLMDDRVGRRWGTMAVPGAFTDRHEQLGARAILEGSGSLVDVDAPAPDWPAPRLPVADLLMDHPPATSGSDRWYVIADSRGRVDWQFTAMDGVRLLVLVCEATPPGYLQRLIDLGVGYLLAGHERVDLREGLRKLRAHLGLDLVVADSGGTLNATLLREGLVDVLDVVTLPGLIGGLGAPTIMDGPELGEDESPILLELLDVATDRGVVRTRYRVLAPSR